MPAKCRVIVCGFDPMIVRGYLKTGERALWWHLPDKVYEDYKVKPGDTISGTLLAVYDGDGNKTATPNEPFSWKASKESGLAILLPPETISKYRLTEFHFLELSLDRITRVGEKVRVEIPMERLGEEAEPEEVIELPKEEEIYPGKVEQRKWWPDDKMKLAYKVGYIE